MEPRSLPGERIIESESNDRSPELCISCGLCCNGAMFEEVWVESGEVKSAQAAGMDVFVKNERPFIALPCKSHQDGKCAIYPTRFYRCSAYQCMLLENYRSGKIGFDPASGQIQKTVRLYEMIREELGLKKTDPFWQSIRALWDTCPEGPGGAGFRRAHAGLLLNILALIRLLGRHFLDNERWLLLKTGFNLNDMP